MRGSRYGRSVVGLLVLVASLAAPGSSGAHAQEHAAAAEDVASIDQIVAALYDVISGEAGDRDWARFESLFHPGARLVPTRADAEGRVQARPASVAEYIEGSAPFFARRPFFEHEIARVVERYGNIAHVFSTYETRAVADSPEPDQRGISSFQLLFDGDRWWIVSMYWRGETADQPIPDRYLPRAADH